MRGGNTKKNHNTRGEETEVSLFKGDGTLYMGEKKRYKPLGESGSFTIEVAADESEKGNFTYWILVYEGEENIYSQGIGNGLMVGYCSRECSVHWPALIDNKLESMAFRFVDRNATMSAEMLMNRFVEMYNRCTYALLTGSAVEHSGTAEDEFYDYLSGIATEQLTDDDYNEPVYELDLQHERSKETGTGNVCYSESMRFNRAVVIRESRNALELQAHAFDANGFESRAPDAFKLPGITSCDDALMDDTETKLLLLDVKENRLHHIDMEYGKVVQEYTPSEDFPLQAVTYGSHVATSSPVYTCLSSRNAFNIDLRLNPKSVVDIKEGESISDYTLSSLRKNFTCHATTKDGHLVIGDALGSIRLYTGPPGSRKPNGSRNPKTAKTLIETKVPIVSVDVTADGQWVVAVCAKHLLLMRTSYKDDKGSDTNGFSSRMGKSKPLPLKLQPTPAQLAVLGGIANLNFASGGFDRYGGEKEVCITACSGNYIFTWSLDGAVRAEESGRACVGESALVKREVIRSSAALPGKVMYLTNRDIRMAPLKRHDRLEKGTKHYSYSL